MPNQFVNLYERPTWQWDLLQKPGQGLKTIKPVHNLRKKRWIFSLMSFFTNISSTLLHPRAIMLLYITKGCYDWSAYKEWSLDWNIRFRIKRDVEVLKEKGNKMRIKQWGIQSQCLMHVISNKVCPINL